MFKGTLEGHGGWVTAIATSSENPDVLLTASRGKSLLAPSLPSRAWVSAC
jgi:guanine nucleotide-binding protein subunit beta-2-like 1 protein